LIALMAASLAGPLSGCATNPATGERMMTFLSPEEEARIGADEHRKLVPAFGGPISDTALQRYVSSVGTLLARTSELPNLRFTFTVLNTDMINAFALPGGYVYITRGLLALANSEAEIAGVLAHEIGHVTARHAAQRHSRSVFAGIGAAAVGILTGSGELANAAGSGFGGYLRSYSRDQEFEADKLGIRYLKRAGFDPRAMASFLSSLRANTHLTARLMGEPSGKVDEANIMSTHPRTLARVQRAAREAGGTPVRNPIVGRDVYLRKIGGMIYGDTPEQGFVRGRDFLHPDLRLRFRVPRDFHLTNQPNQVLAKGPRGLVIIFAAAARAGNRTPYDYLVNVWARHLRLNALDRASVNGMPAASGAARARGRGGVYNLRLVAIRRGARIYRFMFIGPGGSGQRVYDAYRQTVSSFRGVSSSKARSWRPYRIRVALVRRGDTVARMARRMAVGRFAEEHFRVLNGLGPRDRLTPGQRVKIVVEEP
jgi:predicted Zn-dependent protease